MSDKDRAELGTKYNKGDEVSQTVPIAAVRTYAGMTEITDSDILHFREIDRQGISPDKIIPDKMNDIIKYNLGLRNCHLELMIPGPTQKHFVEKLIHLVSIAHPPKPITFRYLDKHYMVEITHFKAAPPRQSLLRNHILEANATLWPFVSWTEKGGTLDSKGKLSLESVIVFEIQESEPRCVHWVGECAYYMADYARYLIDCVKQIYPKMRELPAQRAKPGGRSLTRANDEDSKTDEPTDELLEQLELYIDDIDNFSRVRDVEPGDVKPLLPLDRTEDEIQTFLEEIIGENFHQQDWGGELNDLFTSHLRVKGKRLRAAFLLKGSGTKGKLTIRKCGKNGDQIVRLVDSPADLYVIQHIDEIDERVVADLRGKVRLEVSEGKICQMCIIDGTDTARILKAYGKI